VRLACFATNTSGRPIAELELRHRMRARAEDRIRGARATGLRNLPLHRTAQNRVWLEIVQIALDLLVWMPMLALTGKARLGELRLLRLRLFTAAGQLITTGRRWVLPLPGTGPGPAASLSPSTGSPNPRTPADQRIPVPTTAPPAPEQWNPAPTRSDTRPRPCPPSAAERVMVRRLRRRTITKVRS
jgi:hypothetical protein